MNNISSFEHKLMKHKLIRCLIEFGIIVVNLIILSFRFLNNKIFTKDEYFVVEYLFIIITAATLLIFVFDLLSKFKTIKCGEHYITVHRGLFQRIVYVDTKFISSIIFYSPLPVIETKLSSGVKVTVTFSKDFTKLAHVSFSDDTKSIDL